MRATLQAASGCAFNMNELIHIHSQGAELRADSREVADVSNLREVQPGKHVQAGCQRMVNRSKSVSGIPSSERESAIFQNL